MKTAGAGNTFPSLFSGHSESFLFFTTRKTVGRKFPGHFSGLFPAGFLSHRFVRDLEMSLFFQQIIIFLSNHTDQVEKLRAGKTFISLSCQKKKQRVEPPVVVVDDKPFSQCYDHDWLQAAVPCLVLPAPKLQENTHTTRRKTRKKKK